MNALALVFLALSLAIALLVARVRVREQVRRLTTALAGALDSIRGHAVALRSTFSSWLRETIRSTLLHGSSHGGRDQLTRRLIGTAVGSGLAVLTIAADLALVGLTLASILEVELPRAADSAAAVLTAVVVITAGIYWGALTMEALEWGPSGFLSWPASRAGKVSALSMLLVSVASLMAAAFYRDMLLSTGSAAGGVLASQRVLLLGAAFLALATSVVAFHTLLQLLTVLTVGIAGLFGFVVLTLIALVAGSGAFVISNRRHSPGPGPVLPPPTPRSLLRSGRARRAGRP